MVLVEDAEDKETWAYGFFEPKDECQHDARGKCAVVRKTIAGAVPDQVVVVCLGCGHMEVVG